MAPTPAEFVDRWKNSAGAELANSQSFLSELCDLVGVPRPNPTVAEEERNEYVFEKHVAFDVGAGSHGRVDLYKRDCFILESKQGVERDELAQERLLSDRARAARRRVGAALRGTTEHSIVMKRAAEQARRYAAAVEHGWPPFLIVADVGFCFDLYADFSRTGKSYQPFPDSTSFRIHIGELVREEIRERFRAIWTDPLSLDPARRSAAVTRKIADRLARLAKQLEATWAPDRVAQFLMRCLFTMFAEDVRIGNFPENGFTEFLKSRRDKLDRFVPSLENLWRAMDQGGYADAVEARLMKFNGGLFADCEALPLSADQLELLIEAADSRWEEVEPAIFGTLLERALDPVERHKLGAHYTPRAYVERLVLPTVVEPLREEWQATYAAAVSLYDQGDRQGARELVEGWHQQLCDVSVLDPACGTGNFLYVALELMKRLEGEALLALKDFGGQTPLHHVRPPQFHGIEVNPRAAAIAELVLEIGYLQWQVRSIGREHVNEPILDKERNIECRDALLVWDREEDVLDADGEPVTRWDGRTTKPSPITGEEIPDETARVVEKRYVDARKAEWPKADFIVGNPPFIGSQFFLETLGRGYTDAVRGVYQTEVPGSADFVMYWWNKAARLVGEGEARRAGLITTNSLRQSFNGRVVHDRLHGDSPVSLAFVVADHPWVDEADGAAVRIAMSVLQPGREVPGLLATVNERHGLERLVLSTTHGTVRADLRLGADVRSCGSLSANRGLSFMGVKLVGDGFILAGAESDGFSEKDRELIRPFANGRDLTQTRRNACVIDTFERSLDELRTAHPAILQRLADRVQPLREARRGKSADATEYANRWWQHAKPRPEMREAMKGLSRYIATSEVSKHRVFAFFDVSVLADGALIVQCLDDAYYLGVLSSRIHVTWALATGGTLEDRPRYNKTRCFETFPFPDPDEATKQRIRELGEQLDAHRKRQQELHPTLTMTGMYNVLEKVRAGETLSKKEQQIHEQGLVSVLKQIHDDLDAAVAAAYGWPADLDDESILSRLVELNRERAEEERRGLVRWLRPEFQNPAAARQAAGGKTQRSFAGDEEDEPAAAAPAPAKKLAWPTENDVRPQQERVRLLRQVLSESRTPLSVDEVARRFSKANKKKVRELLETLVAVGQARSTPDERYAL